MSAPTPYGARIAITAPPADAAHSGIYLPPGSNVGPKKGVIVAVGDEVEHLEKGMLVYYHDHSLYEIGDVSILDVQCVLAFEAL